MPYFHSTINQCLKTPNELSLEQKKKIASAMIATVKAMQDQHIVHGDFHLDNWVLDNNYHPFLIDFECSVIGASNRAKRVEIESLGTALGLLFGEDLENHPEIELLIDDIFKNGLDTMEKIAERWASLP